jgi:hypothetical protein
MQFGWLPIVSEKINRPKGDDNLSGDKLKIMHEVKVPRRY